MPQMAPISWLFLYLMFTGTLILFNIMNYYSTLPPAPKSQSLKMISINSMDWKW